MYRNVSGLMQRWLACTTVHAKKHTMCLHTPMTSCVSSVRRLCTVIKINIHISFLYTPHSTLLVSFVIFRISAASPQLNTSVFVCQMFATLRLLVQTTKDNISNSDTRYCVWCLETRCLPHCHSSESVICLSLNTMRFVALDYVVALYPHYYFVCAFECV